MRHRLYGDPEYKYGHVIAGIYVSSHAQARLLQEILQREMRERAGRPEEGLLAKWHNELVSIRTKADRDSWIGWEDF